ncbi:MAG TPA: MopE-related protein, partial [Polyangiaceae bacterium LLY-WYZ-15_(1-7)]|nr:MopE-related protein [Polyangiaceae bacterium LLY-WYZ-15_(1-7)]
DDRDARVFPGAAEVCDMVDQDCDGRSDEGTLSECGDCRPGCTVVTLPDETGTSWDDVAEESSGVEVAPDGTLRLGETRTESTFAWIANTRYGTLTKLDLETGAQIAEYDSVLLDGTNGARPPGEECDSESQGNCPSRTAVDLRGNVYVGNRAFSNQGTVTKIAGREEDCIDRNGNGRIDTSRDLDADGVIDRDGREYLGQADECILWTADVGGRNGIPRALAIDAEGFVWVGLNGTFRVLRLDPSDGETVRNISLFRRDEFRPYGAAIGGDGTVWFTEALTGRLIGIEAGTGSVTHDTVAGGAPTGCVGSYGIAVDQENRVWLAGISCPAAFRYDPADESWFAVGLPDSGGTRGIAADDRGWIYVGASHSYIRISPLGFSFGDPVARLTRFRADDGSELQVFGTEDEPLPGLATVGVGLDGDRNVWMVNQDSGTATRLNPETGAVREFPVGDTPYTYSDFTGFALRTFTVPNGFLRTIVPGCAAGPTSWEELSWEARVPSGTAVEVRARTADTPEGLRSAEWIGPWRAEPVNLGEPPGPLPQRRYLELEVSLTSEDESATPRLDTVSVQYNCL